MQRSVRTVEVVKSVGGAVPAFRPARFLGPLPEPAGGFHRNGLRRYQVRAGGGLPGAQDGRAPVAVAVSADRGGVEQARNHR